MRTKGSQKLTKIPTKMLGAVHDSQNNLIFEIVQNKIVCKARAAKYRDFESQSQLPKFSPNLKKKNGTLV